jgi:hypothetical protein
MNYRLQGTEGLPRFVQESVKAGALSEWYASVRPLGPLATFDGNHTGVDHTYKNGLR